MPDLSPDLLTEIREFGDELIERFTPPEFIPGCSVKVITDKDLYATDNGWIECIVSQHNQQRCRWRGQVPNIQVNDIVDVMYFKSYRLFVVFGQGGVGAQTQNILHKFDATTAPTADEDSGDGYSVGSQWLDVTNDKFYICADATATAAVWLEPAATGGGGDYVALAEDNLTSGTQATFDFTSISASYKHLELIASLRIDDLASIQDFEIRFNNDSGSNYDYHKVTTDGAAAHTTADTNAGRATSGIIGRAEASFATANVSSTFRCIIPNYARTDMNKTCMAWSEAMQDDNATGDYQQTTCSVTWHDTSAISRVTLLVTGKLFTADSHVILYGVSGP